MAALAAVSSLAAAALMRTRRAKLLRLSSLFVFDHSRDDLARAHSGGFVGPGLLRSARGVYRWIGAGLRRSGWTRRTLVRRLIEFTLGAV
jgi:hypothetical protein